jgi:hypothetical protein
MTVQLRLFCSQFGNGRNGLWIAMFEIAIAASPYEDADSDMLCEPLRAEHRLPPHCAGNRILLTRLG